MGTAAVRLHKAGFVSSGSGTQGVLGEGVGHDAWARVLPDGNDSWPFVFISGFLNGRCERFFQNSFTFLKDFRFLSVKGQARTGPCDQQHGMQAKA